MEDVPSGCPPCYNADSNGVMEMAKEKKKSGTGQGTGKKGWNRWKAGSNKAKSFKPYTSKNKKSGENKSEEQSPEERGWIDG